MTEARPTESPEPGQSGARGRAGAQGRDRWPTTRRERLAELETRRAEQSRRTRHEPAGTTPAVHRPGGFGFDDSFPNRHQCWDMLEPSARDKLEQKAGGVWAWWARLDPDGRPKAFVFGPRGLCQAGFVIRGGRPVLQGERLKLEPGSVRRRSFSTTGPGTDAPPATEGLRADAAHGALQSPPGAARSLNLDQAARGALGNFPAEVQEFLQRPFLADDQGLVADWYGDQSLELTHERIFAVFCLTADRHVTVAAGTRTRARGRSEDRARWDVECWHGRIHRG
ncbi:hypothetical protein ACIHEJ_06280 [Streptomyces sp. NPDC052301]|uniref:hypothetical protein n=1 Tax=Streptomyces sp. NPDC052301 TaxID=3365687 RepID=UPI0037D71C5B